MFGFKKKEPVIDGPTKAWGESFERDAMELRSFRKVGESFNYLGRRCLVTGYKSKMIGSPGLGPVDFIPRMQYDYADELGVIHHENCGVFDLEAIRAENPSDEAPK